MLKVEADIELAKKYLLEVIRRIKPMPDGSISVDEEGSGKVLILRSEIIFDLGSFIAESLPPEVAYDVGKIAGKESGKRIVEILRKDLGIKDRKELLRHVITNYYCNGLFQGKLIIDERRATIEMRGLLTERIISSHRPKDEWEERRWKARQYIIVGYIAGILGVALERELRLIGVEVLRDGLKAVYEVKKVEGSS